MATTHVILFKSRCFQQRFQHMTPTVLRGSGAQGLRGSGAQGLMIHDTIRGPTAGSKQKNDFLNGGALLHPGTDYIRYNSPPSPPCNAIEKKYKNRE